MKSRAFYECSNARYFQGMEKIPSTEHEAVLFTPFFGNNNLYNQNIFYTIKVYIQR